MCARRAMVEHSRWVARLLPFAFSVFACSRTPSTEPSKPDESAAPASATVGSLPAVPSLVEATAPRDSRPFVIASREQALERVRALPEAREALRVGGTMSGERKLPRDVWMSSEPATGCLEDSPECRWTINSGLQDEAYVDRSFFIDARSGAITVFFDEAWPKEEQDQAPKPIEEWRAMKRRSDAAWSVLHRLPEVARIKTLGIVPRAPQPYTCTRSEKTPCVFRFDICERVRTGPCEVGLFDWVAGFAVDEATHAVKVDAGPLTQPDGATVTLERYRELVTRRGAARKAISKSTCGGVHLDVVTSDPVERSGCRSGDAGCAFSFAVLLTVGNRTFANRVLADESGKVSVFSRLSRGARGPAAPIAAWCKRALAGQELDNRAQP